MDIRNRLNIRVQRYSKYLNIYLMFAVVFLYHTLFVFQGLDMTDFGYHMTHQVFSFTYSPEIERTSPLIFLTDFIGGMWLSLIGHPSVLWARFGGVFLVALNASIVYSILGDYFEKKNVFFVVLVSSIFITMGSHIYIHYFSFPAFLVNIELWIFNKIVLIKEWTKKSERYSFVLGFMIVPIILSRVTLLLIFIVPIFFAIYFYLGGDNCSHIKKVIAPASQGIFISIIFFGLFYWYIGILENYLLETFKIIFSSAKGDTTKIDSSHIMSNLFKLYIVEYVYIIIGSLIFVFGIYILSIIKEKVGPKINILIISATLGSIILISGWILILGWPTSFFALRAQKVSIGIVIILSVLFFVLNEEKKKSINLLLISSLTVMIVNPIGSGAGVFKSIDGMWLILPLVLLCTYKIKTDVKNERILSMLSLTTIILISVLLLSVSLQITNLYRDDQNRLNLNTEFSDITLRGIYSTPNKVDIVDEFLAQVRTYSDKGDNVLMVNSIPLYYYLTETKPALGEPWLEIRPVGKIEKRQQELEQKGDLPKLFIYSKLDTNNRKWPNTKNVCIESHTEKLEYLKNRYIKDLNYSLLWENEAFAIYGKNP
jgi:hypothetical protein